GTGALTWSITSGTAGGLTLSPTGVLSGTPQSADNFSFTVTVRDSATPPLSNSRNYILAVAFPALPAISVGVTNPGGQTVPTASLGQSYAVPLTGTFTLSFTPNAQNLPAGYTNADVKFASGGTTADVNIPAGSTAAVTLPAVQLGSVAGTVNVTLTALKSTQ